MLAPSCKEDSDISSFSISVYIALCLAKVIDSPVSGLEQNLHFWLQDRLSVYNLN